MHLAELPVRAIATVTYVAGSGSFRRRLMELGILPGTRVQVLSVAPLGDPLELLVRGSSLSIRRNEAMTVEVAPITQSELLPQRAQASALDVRMTSSARGAP